MGGLEEDFFIILLYGEQSHVPGCQLHDLHQVVFCSSAQGMVCRIIEKDEGSEQGNDLDEPSAMDDSFHDAPLRSKFDETFHINHCIILARSQHQLAA